MSVSASQSREVSRRLNTPEHPSYPPCTSKMLYSHTVMKYNLKAALELHNPTCSLKPDRTSGSQAISVSDWVGMTQPRPCQ